MIYQYYEKMKDYNFSDNEILVFGCHELGKHHSGYAQIAFHCPPLFSGTRSRRRETGSIIWYSNNWK